MIGSYGKIKFKFNSKQAELLNDLTIQKTARYVEHSRINYKPLLQFMGEELTTISFTMELYSELGVNPRKEVEKLEKHLKRGDVNKFIVGNKNFGTYVIESISQTVNMLDNKGMIQGLSVNVTLKEYIR